MKKADLSMNTIVIAAIVLIVLVVIVLIFTGRIGGFTKGLQDCQNKGGIGRDCYKDSTVKCCLDGEAAIFNYKDEGSSVENKACCLPVTSEAKTNTRLGY
jgi:hypothetical protein